MSSQTKSNDQGFTLIEIVVVMILISIIAATVFSRSITTNQVNFVGQTDKIISHIHYAQSMAMKRNEVWGIFNTGNEYWMFQYINPGDEINRKPFPGYETDTISLSDLHLSMTFFVLYFDGIGKPYEMNRFNPLTTDLEITIDSSDGPESKDFYITPETGLIRLQP